MGLSVPVVRGDGMQVCIDFGHEQLNLEVPEGKVVAVRRGACAPPLSDPAAAVRAALESPYRYPALRKALTPDDRVALVVDEHVAHLPELVLPILEHLTAAHIPPEAITLLFTQPGPHGWVRELPPAFRHVAVEVHDPGNRQRLSYLATTRHGRRLYLNRTAVDADQVVVLGRRGYDPLLGYSGSAGALYPALSDEPTRQELCDHLTMAVPGDKPWPVQREAEEAAWLLGAPFMVQVIEGSGEELVHVLGGDATSGREGQRMLDARWRVEVDRPADIVIAGAGGDPARQEFGDLAQALACAARVVRPGGRIVFLSRACPALGRGAELICQADDAQEALTLLRREKPADMAAAFQWASAVQQASVYLLSGLPADTAEDLFTTPLDDTGQVARLLAVGGSYLFLPDAHKTLAVPAA
jgi:nickel-dependent lactate racemase